MSVEKINNPGYVEYVRPVLFNQDSQYKYDEDFEKLKPKQKVSIIKEMQRDTPRRAGLPQEAYLKTNDKTELLQLAKATGTMEQISRQRWESHPFLLWESYKEAQYIDSHIIIFDKDVSTKLLQKQMKRDINTRRKNYQVTSSYLEAQESAFEKLWKEINEYSSRKNTKESLVQNYMQNGGEENINKSTLEMKEIGFVASRGFYTILFANHKKTIFKGIDARYYAGLMKEWENPTFYTRGKNRRGRDVLVLKAEDETKAIILPVIKVYSNDHDPDTKLIQEVKSEAKNAEDRT